MNDGNNRDIKSIVLMYGSYPTLVNALQSLSWKREKDYMLER